MPRWSAQKTATLKTKANLPEAGVAICRECAYLGGEGEFRWVAFPYRT